jgi:NitT/TauT family transport system substrate-binding protein
MLTRRSFIYCGLAASSLLTTTLTSCTPSTTKTPLRVGLVDWPGYEPFYMAQSLGFYDQTGIELVPFVDSTEVIRAHRQQQIDCTCITISDVLQLATTQNEQRLIMVIDQSAGADVILAKPQINDLAELKGKRIGSDLSALSAYILGRALETVKLTLQDIQLVNFGLSDQLAAYQADRFDAVITFDPFRTQLVNAGAKTLFDSTAIPNEVFDAMVVSQTTLNQHQPTLQVLIQGFFKALDYLQQNRQDAITRMATREKVTPDEFEKALKLLKYSDLAQNQTMLDRENSPLIPVAAKLNQVMIEQKLLQQTVDFKSLLTNAALPSS